MTNSIPIGHEIAVTNANGNVTFITLQKVEWGIDLTPSGWMIIAFIIASAAFGILYFVRKKRLSK